MRVPTSRAGSELRLHWFDVAWAVAAPALAIAIRDLDADPATLSASQIVYCLFSSVAAIWFFWSFRIREAIPSYFSASDAFEVVKACGCAAIAGTALTFAFTRLDGVPRSTPFIYAFLLVAGLLAARAIMRVYFSDVSSKGRVAKAEPEHVILIGADRATLLFVNLLKTCSSSETRVVAVLDGRKHLVGRSIARISIVGSPRDLDAIVDEFAVHGVGITRVVVSASHLDAGSLQNVLDVCAARRIECDTLANMATQCLMSMKPSEPVADSVRPPVALPYRYISWKRLIDIAVASTLLVAAAPILLAISIIIRIDVGSPVLFWQRRVGRNGRTFLLYKFRTLRAPFDRHGSRLSDAERLSVTGIVLRALHCDELPQLLNVINGDMSLVGPRPLLSIDQPRNPTVRLMVRPGITGWAQLNGGKSISPNEKGMLDDWYVKHLSFGLDAKIIMMTALRVLQGGSSETWEGDAAAASLPIPDEQLR